MGSIQTCRSCFGSWLGAVRSPCPFCQAQQFRTRFIELNAKVKELELEEIKITESMDSIRNEARSREAKIREYENQCDTCVIDQGKYLKELEAKVTNREVKIDFLRDRIANYRKGAETDSAEIVKRERRITEQATRIEGLEVKVKELEGIISNYRKSANYDANRNVELGNKIKDLEKVARDTRKYMHVTAEKVTAKIKELKESHSKQQQEAIALNIAAWQGVKHTQWCMSRVERGCTCPMALHAEIKRLKVGKKDCQVCNLNAHGLETKIKEKDKKIEELYQKQRKERRTTTHLRTCVKEQREEIVNMEGQNHYLGICRQLCILLDKDEDLLATELPATVERLQDDYGKLLEAKVEEGQYTTECTKKWCNEVIEQRAEIEKLQKIISEVRNQYSSYRAATFAVMYGGSGKDDYEKRIKDQKSEIAKLKERNLTMAEHSNTQALRITKCLKELSKEIVSLEKKVGELQKGKAAADSSLESEKFLRECFQDVCDKACKLLGVTEAVDLPMAIRVLKDGGILWGTIN